MSDNEALFEEDDQRRKDEDAATTLVIDIAGYEGPIDVLLALAREQKVDLTRISILQLADQYLAFILRIRHTHLELAADYLVMAAWLAYLKSRLLLPEPPAGEEPSAADMAAALTYQLQRLEAMQAAGKRLMALPRLGIDVFKRGMPEDLRPERLVVYDLTLYELLKSYSDFKRREQSSTMTIEAMELYAIDEALKRLEHLVGRVPGWHTLFSFLPTDLVGNGLLSRSILASSFVATLELTRLGKLELRQEGPFEPIYIRPGGVSAPTSSEAPS
ncbi:MAG: segregation/condensation protein A [Alphaproteobacteria bacterium]|jgi:segregation and condensation protein A|nr:segregation/condensation protein A [Alphaproteobacteria bacterium]MBF0354172.1 segregation/condensation protein A [Alphaproteobacteria bacterium]